MNRINCVLRIYELEDGCQEVWICFNKRDIFYYFSSGSAEHTEISKDVEISRVTRKADISDTFVKEAVDFYQKNYNVTLNINKDFRFLNGRKNAYRRQ